MEERSFLFKLLQGIYGLFIVNTNFIENIDLHIKI